MNTYLFLLHLLHVVCALIWGGIALMFHFFLLPASEKFGREGGRFLVLLVSTNQFSKVVSAAGAITIICGILLFYETSGHWNAVWLSSPKGIVLSAGAIAGLVATWGGWFINKPAVSRISDISKELSASGIEPTATQTAEITSLRTRIRQGSEMVAWSILVSLITMAGSQYIF